MVYVVFTFGGKSVPWVSHEECSSRWNLTSESVIFEPYHDILPFNCYPELVHDCLKMILMTLWVGYLLHVVLDVLVRIRGSCSGTRANMSYLCRRFSFWLNIMIAAAIPLVATDAVGFSYRRDISGFLVVLCCVQASLQLRDHLGDRELASMINWTEVVSRSMISFFLVHGFIFAGFAIAFYVQLHTDCNPIEHEHYCVGPVEVREEHNQVFQLLTFINSPLI